MKYNFYNAEILVISLSQPILHFLKQVDISPYSHLLLDWGPNGVRKDPSVQLTLVQMGVVQLGLVQFGLQMGGGPLFPSHCQCAEQSTSQIDKILLIIVWCIHGLSMMQAK